MVMYLYLFLLVFNDMLIIVFRGNLLMALRNRTFNLHDITPQIPMPFQMLRLML